MGADEPTPGEIMRRLDETSRRLDSLAKDLAEDRRDFAKNYVPRELYEARHLHLDRRVGLLEVAAEEKEKADDASRRQLQFMILGAILAAGLSLIVALILASGGISS